MTVCAKKEPTARELVIMTEYFLLPTGILQKFPLKEHNLAVVCPRGNAS